MKKIQKILFLFLFSSSSLLVAQTNLNDATPDTENGKFTVSIIQADNDKYINLGASISHYRQKFRYTFEWFVDGEPAGNKPLLRKASGKLVELRVTRYPGKDQSTASLQLDTEICDLPLFPRKTGSHKILSGYASIE